MKHHSLVTKIRRLMASDQSPSLEALARQSGLSYHWLQKFRSGKIPEPGATKLLVLAEAFGTVTFTPTDF
jgi:transcriptional regulator with XRE-family HTH domain